MLSSRGVQKFDRLTVTLVPTSEHKTFRNVPSTFSSVHRSYEWRKSESMNYMIVPKKITSAKVEVDFYVSAARKGKAHPKHLQKAVLDFIRAKIESEWKGFRLGAVGRVGSAVPPQKTFVRGSIEDILGVTMER